MTKLADLLTVSPNNLLFFTSSLKLVSMKVQDYYVRNKYDYNYFSFEYIVIII